MSISALFPEKAWHKDNYLISTSAVLLDHDLINATFASDDIYWTGEMEPARLKIMLDLSLCFGVYEVLPQASESDSQLKCKPFSCPLSPPSPSPFHLPQNPQQLPTQYIPLTHLPAPATRPSQIGLARLVTDTISHAYLTDAFILPAHRNHGLGRWLLECVNETVSSWPDLRRFCLFTSGAVARRFYGEVLGMVEFGRGEGSGEGEGEGDQGGRGEFLVFPEGKDLGGLEFMCQDRGVVRRAEEG